MRAPQDCDGSVRGLDVKILAPQRRSREKRSPVITGRELLREEIEQVWNIDRTEVIEAIYRFENGTLLLRPQHHDVSGWPPGEAEKYTPILLDCLDRGGWFYGLFDDAKLVGTVVVESKFIGKHKDQLQLKFLHVSSSYRNRGLGTRLFELARATARERGARRIYISATPSENTVNFYLRLGCAVAHEPDPELFELEPEDIHLECDV
jgi:predicted N-acetyltransferase YhbS